MGGQIDWSALPFVVEFLGLDDVEILVIHLMKIREKQANG